MADSGRPKTTVKLLCCILKEQDHSRREHETLKGFLALRAWAQDGSYRDRDFSYIVRIYLIYF
jgi:hypothetical protein